MKFRGSNWIDKRQKGLEDFYLLMIYLFGFGFYSYAFLLQYHLLTKIRNYIILFQNSYRYLY